MDRGCAAPVENVGTAGPGVRPTSIAKAIRPRGTVERDCDAFLELVVRQRLEPEICEGGVRHKHVRHGVVYADSLRKPRAPSATLRGSECGGVDRAAVVLQDEASDAPIPRASRLDAAGSSGAKRTDNVLISGAVDVDRRLLQNGALDQGTMRKSGSIGIDKHACPTMLIEEWGAVLGKPRNKALQSDTIAALPGRVGSRELVRSPTTGGWGVRR